jgi:uncharacterized protein (TIGR00645 family)
MPRHATRDYNNPDHNPTALGQIGKLIFGMRWMLVPLYVGLFIIMAAYDVQYFSEMIRTAINFAQGKDSPLLLLVIDMMDTIMVANFIFLLAVSGYGLFVNEYRDIDFDGQHPTWIEDANSSFKQKIKMAVSLIGISSVDLLHSFVAADKVSWDVILKQISIHALFIVSTIALCYMHTMMHSPHEQHV